MKREADDDMGSLQKRARGPISGDTELRLLIHSKSAGSVIGKGGHNITRLRNENKATITVPDCPGPERILTVTADQEIVLHVLDDVIPNLDDSNRMANRQSETELRMLVHQSQAGCIIGKSGFKIKELRENCGAQIKVYSNCCPLSTDRVVQIVGTPEVCRECVHHILELLKESPAKGTITPYDPHHYDDYYASEYGGYGDSSGKNNRGGSRGGNMSAPRSAPYGQGPMGHGNNRSMNMGSSGMRRPAYSGNLVSAPMHGGNRGGYPPSNRMYSSRGAPDPYRAEPPMNSCFPFAEFNREICLGQGPPNGVMNTLNFGDAVDTDDGDNSDKKTTQVTIPKDLAGAIIGKGGARIRKIRSDSGAGITIDEALPGSNDRIITINGSTSQIQMAQYLLQQSVREHGGPRKY